MLAAAREGRLLSMELEMTLACNLRCTYCYAAAGNPLPDELTLAEIKDVVHQAVELGARKIVVLGGGEPCLYPQLHDLIAFLDDLDLAVELFTNGTLVDENLARFFHDYRVTVVVKRNSGATATQDALAGVPGTAERIEAGLANLLRVGYPDPSHGLGVQTVICRQNLDEIPDMWRWARSRKILPYFECITEQGRACAVENEQLHLTPEEVRDIFEKLSAIDREEYGIEWMPHPPLVASSCARHLYSILVKSNGDIHPCVGVDISAGNVRRQRLADVLRTDPVITDLRNVYSRIKGPCRSCRLNGECYGCRGSAFQLTGDYLASDPGCWVKAALGTQREANL